MNYLNIVNDMFVKCGAFKLNKSVDLEAVNDERMKETAILIVMIMVVCGFYLFINISDSNMICTLF